MAAPTPPAPVAAHGSYLPSTAVITEGKSVRCPRYRASITSAEMRLFTWRKKWRA